MLSTFEYVGPKTATSVYIIERTHFEMLGYTLL
jgi:hypothetical protein